MKHTRSLLTLALTAIAVLAQTALNPQLIDWRYKLTFDDPNPAGMVLQWAVYASNSPSNVRLTQVAGGATPLTLSYKTFLAGMPRGTYAVWVTPTSAIGDVGDPSTNHVVVWPGGDGKIAPGQGMRSSK